MDHHKTDEGRPAPYDGFDRFARSCLLAYQSGRRCAFLLPLSPDGRWRPLLTLTDDEEGGRAGARLLRALRAQGAMHAALARRGERGASSIVVCTLVPERRQSILALGDGTTLSATSVRTRSLTSLLLELEIPIGPQDGEP